MMAMVMVVVVVVVMMMTMMIIMMMILIKANVRGLNNAIKVVFVSQQPTLVIEIWNISSNLSQF